MRVLLVTHYFPEHGGGVEIVARELAVRLARRGFSITWAASSPAPARPDDGVSYLPVKAWNATERRLGFPYPLWGPAGLARLASAVKQSDLVHLHDCLYQGNALALLRARLAGKPIVVTQHVGQVPYRRALLRGLLATANRTLGRVVLGGATQTVFVSRKVLDYFRPFVRFRSEPLGIPNGVDTETFCPVSPAQRDQLRREFGWQEGRPTFLFVGRFVEKKGLAHLRRLAQRFPGIQWVLIGWGPEDPSLWRLPNVLSLGRVDHAELPPYYRAADLLVLPSVGEGFPLVVQEAMACGTPALLSDDTAPGSPGIETVAIVSALQEDALAAAVRDFLESRSQWDLLRIRSAQYARQWSWDDCAARYADVFDRLVRREE
jgi:glycosyltransferase involved in cell wall biosynthesis